ncbi:MAG TPA: acyl-CoA dehydrogenase family protein [Acidimicrobiales bacterium]|nr:acyl-CoA dehydrogenase family protein [Acidimicrobiales bacterium]
MDVVGEAKAWVAEAWSPERTLRDWWGQLAESGYAFPTFPKGMGGCGATAGEARQISEALAAAGAIGPPGGLGQMMGAPVVLEHGTEEQQDRWVRRLAAGLESWCQLFSEPAAGSDLASLQTRAIRDGDVWIVNGQKVWTSGATTADRGMLVARTDPDQPKHRGITYFIIDMDQPGIEVRPLRQMDGGSTFNEVFFTDAVVPNDAVVGSVNNGWMVAVSTLAFERQGIGGGRAGMTMVGAPGEKNGALDRPIRDLLEASKRRAGEQQAAMTAGSVGAVIDLTRDLGRTGEAVLRDRLASMYALSEAHRMSTLRMRAAAAKGRMPGPEVSTGKLLSAELGRRARDLSLAVQGPAGMLVGDDAPAGGRFQQMALRIQSSSIAGGTDEVQRNIIGERVLGLPKEPQVDRDVPFRETRTS